MNETLSRLKQFLKRPFFTDPRTLLWLWLLLALGSALIKFHKCNNFLIFKYVFLAYVESDVSLRSLCRVF